MLEKKFTLKALGAGVVVLVLMATAFYFGLSINRENIIINYAVDNVGLTGVKLGDKELTYDQHEADRLKVLLFKKSVVRNFKERNPDAAREIISELIDRGPVELSLQVELSDTTVIEKKDFVYKQDISQLAAFKKAVDPTESLAELNREDIANIPWLVAYLDRSVGEGDYNGVVLSWEDVYAGSKKFSSLEESALIDLAADHFFKTSSRVGAGVRAQWLFASL